MAGRLDQIDALATELGLPPRAAVGDLVAEGYARWGSRLPGHLHGSFAVAAWNDAAGTGLVAVDRLASASVFVASSSDTVLFATELGLLLDLLRVQPMPDRSAVTHWLVSGTTPYGRTLYEGIRRLADGEMLTVEGGRVSSGRYWSPRYEEPLTGGRRELADEVATAVRRAVRRRLPSPDGAAAILVSGGLDSGSVAAFAAEAAAAAGVRLRGYSATFPDRPAMDESGLVRELADSITLPVELLSVHTTSMLTSALDYLQAWRVPSLSPNLHFLQRLAAAASAGGADIVLDGEGGDELFGLAAFYLADLVRHGRVLRAGRLARRVPWYGTTPTLRQAGELLWEYGGKGALPPGAHRLRRRRRTVGERAPSWINVRAAAALVDVDEDWAWKTRRDGPLWWRDRVDSLIVARQLVGGSDHLRRVHGPEALDAHPLLDDFELIELMLRVSPVASFDPEFDRPLLRAATDGLLPDSIRLRREKTYLNELFVDCLEGPDWPAVKAFVGDRDARVNDYVRPEVVRAGIIEAPPERRDGAWAWVVWRLLAVETWLRSLDDSRFPARALEDVGVH